MPKPKWEPVGTATDRAKQEWQRILAAAKTAGLPMPTRHGGLYFEDVRWGAVSVIIGQQASHFRGSRQYEINRLFCSVSVTDYWEKARTFPEGKSGLNVEKIVAAIQEMGAAYQVRQESVAQREANEASARHAITETCGGLHISGLWMTARPDGDVEIEVRVPQDKLLAVAQVLKEQGVLK